MRSYLEDTQSKRHTEAAQILPKDTVDPYSGKTERLLPLAVRPPGSLSLDFPPWFVKRTGASDVW